MNVFSMKIYEKTTNHYLRFLCLFPLTPHLLPSKKIVPFTATMSHR